MSTLLKTLKTCKVTKNKVADVTGLSVPTVRKYLKQPDLFSIKNCKDLVNHLKSKDYEYTIRELFNIKEQLKR